MSEPWFERYPDLLEWELGRFAARGLVAEIDEVARGSERLVIRSRVTFHGEEIEIEVHYPDETPELPPVVFGPVGLLDRHEHAFNGNFCLLERPLDDWPAGEWGAADLIAERLSALLRDSERGPAVVRASEAAMPEPHTAYYSYPFGAVVLMPATLTSPERDGGVLSLRPFAGEGGRFVVESVSGKTADGALLSSLLLGERINVRWKRVNTPPPGPDGVDVLRWIRKEHPELIQHATRLPPKLARSRRIAPPALQVAAVVFDEEGPRVGETHDAWLFVCLPPAGAAFLAHCQVTSLEERQRRTPELIHMADARVVVVGLGTLGGDVATELAKAGAAHLDLVDFDRYEINNSVRHVLGLEWSGLAKGDAVAQSCRRLNPFCETNPVHLQLGAVQWSGESSLAHLERLISSADVVVETSGAHQIQHLVGRLTQEAGVAMISCWLTAGFYGAHVIRLVPRVTSCVRCTARAFSDCTIIAADEGPDDQVVAQGCSHPTVAGAGFDAAEAAAVATRLTVQTLLRGDGYPDAEWDHAAISFRRSPGDRVYPRFAAERLTPTEGCPQCSSAVGSSTLH